MKPQTVFFTDDKISPEQLKRMAQHEHQHAAWEPFDGQTRCVKNFKPNNGTVFRLPTIKPVVRPASGSAAVKKKTKITNIQPF